MLDFPSICKDFKNVLVLTPLYILKSITLFLSLNLLISNYKIQIYLAKWLIFRMREVIFFTQGKNYLSIYLVTHQPTHLSMWIIIQQIIVDVSSGRIIKNIKRDEYLGRKMSWSIRSIISLSFWYMTPEKSQFHKVIQKNVITKRFYLIFVVVLQICEFYL